MNAQLKITRPDSLSFVQAIELLQALAEPTRCRLLALLRHGELTVGEIASVLSQSQPRISRHLKVLTAVRALERFREEQRIYYRLTRHVSAAELVTQILQCIHVDDAVFQADSEQLALILEQRVRSASAHWDDVRRSAESTYTDPQLVRSVLHEVADYSLAELLDVGTGSGSMLRVLASRARRAIGLDMSTHALRVARAKVHGDGLNHCLFQRGDMYDLPFETGSFDAVTFDHVLSAAERPLLAVREAKRVLRPGGRVIVIEDTERLAGIAAEPAAPVVKRWLEKAGMQCEKLKALETHGKQLLLGIGRRK